MSKLIEIHRPRARLVAIADLSISSLDLIVCLLYVFKLSEWFVAGLMRRDMSGQAVDSPGTPGWITAGLTAFVLLISFFLIIFQLNFAYGLWAATHKTTPIHQSYSASSNYSFSSLIFILFIGVRVIGLQLEVFSVVLLLSLLALRCVGLVLVYKFSQAVKSEIENSPLMDVVTKEVPSVKY